MICSQEGDKGIECLHIKFTLTKDVFESRMIQKQGGNAEYMFESRMNQKQGENTEYMFKSRMTQKQGENVEYMFESRTTQMQKGENDEDITNIDTPTTVASNSKVKLFCGL
jgi:hypothetical protein